MVLKKTYWLKQYIIVIATDYIKTVGCFVNVKYFIFKWNYIIELLDKHQAIFNVIYTLIIDWLYAIINMMKL